MMELKKWMALALAGTMCFSMLTACGGDDEEYVEDEDIVEEEIVEDEELPEDEEIVEDEELPEDEEIVEDEDVAAEGELASYETLVQHYLVMTLFQHTLDLMGESYTDDTAPDDVKAVMPEMQAMSEQYLECDPMALTEDEIMYFTTNMAAYTEVMLPYVELDPQTYMDEMDAQLRQQVDEAMAAAGRTE